MSNQQPTDDGDTTRLQALERRCDALSRRISHLEDQIEEVDSVVPERLKKYGPQYERPVIRTLEEGETYTFSELEDRVRMSTKAKRDSTVMGRVKDILSKGDFQRVNDSSWRFAPEDE